MKEPLSKYGLKQFQRVWCKEFTTDEGAIIPREQATIDSFEVMNGMIVIGLDEEYLTSPEDDGVRELEVTEIEEAIV